MILLNMWSGRGTALTSSIRRSSWLIAGIFVFVLTSLTPPSVCRFIVIRPFTIVDTVMPRMVTISELVLVDATHVSTLSRSSHRFCIRLVFRRASRRLFGTIAFVIIVVVATTATATATTMRTSKRDRFPRIRWSRIKCCKEIGKGKVSNSIQRTMYTAKRILLIFRKHAMEIRLGLSSHHQTELHSTSTEST